MWLPALRALSGRARDVFVFFNNHYAGHAPGSIELFRSLWAAGGVGGGKTTPAPAPDPAPAPGAASARGVASGQDAASAQGSPDPTPAQDPADLLSGDAE